MFCFIFVITTALLYYKIVFDLITFIINLESWCSLVVMATVFIIIGFFSFSYFLMVALLKRLETLPPACLKSFMAAILEFLSQAD